MFLISEFTNRKIYNTVSTSVAQRMITAMMWIMVEFLMMPREVSKILMVLMPWTIPAIIPQTRRCHRCCQRS
ncbi:Dihydroorotase [Dirofilaria immitis]